MRRALSLSALSRAPARTEHHEKRELSRRYIRENVPKNYILLYKISVLTISCDRLVLYHLFVYPGCAYTASASTYTYPLA